MPDLSLDLRYLRYVLAVEEQGSFRRAAAKLDLSQSTVSRRVKLLENRIGIAIFHRDHAGVTLTPAGRRFVDEALVGAQHFTNALGAMNSIRHARGGTLRLGMFASLSNGFLRTLVGDYRRRYPHVECHLEEGTAQSSVGGVLDRRLDVAFVTGKPTAPRCESLALWDERLYVALPPGHKFVSTEGIDAAVLRNERFIVTQSGRGPEIEDFLLARLSEPGFRPDIQLHAVSRETLLHMVELGFGLAIVTQNAIARASEGVSFRPMLGVHSSVRSSAIWLKSNPNPALRPLIALAKLIKPHRQDRS